MSSGVLSGMRCAASVFGLSEYLKEKMLLYLTSFTSLRVSWKSFSFSPGNPTMISVEIVMSGMLALILLMRFR